MTNRRTVDIPTRSHGWEHPWPNAFEISRAFPPKNWTLVGGLMVQLHSLLSGISVVRPTDDLDMLLHIEIATGLPAEAARVLEQLGYTLRPPTSRKAPAYRFTRNRDVIDVMSADHAAPSRRGTMRSSPMFAVDGGTQALQRTMMCHLTDGGELPARFSVPDGLGALVLKGAAYAADARDRDRHLFDAALLAATITDHAAELLRLKGSDAKRIRTLRDALSDVHHPAWLALPADYRIAGQDTLRILS